MNNHAGDTYKMLNLQTKCIWKSQDIRWIAKSIMQLEHIHDQDAKQPSDDDDDDVNTVAKYVQATGVNLIPANDNVANQEDVVDNTDNEEDWPACSSHTPSK